MARQTQSPPPRVGQNLPGAFSLFLLFGAGVYTLATMDHAAAACSELYPILAVLFGSALGFVWELFGGPVSVAPFVKGVRIANVALVNVSLFRLSASLSSLLDYPLLYVCLGAFAFLYSYLGHDQWRMRILLPLLQVSAIVVALFADSDRLTLTSRVLLSVTNALNMVAAVIAQRVPQRLMSFVLHLIFTASFVVYPFAIANLSSNLSFCPAFGSPSPSPFDLFLTFPRALLAVVTHIPTLLALAAGLVAGARLSRTNMNELRYDSTFPFWVLLHRFLLSSPGPSPTVPPAPGSVSPVSLTPPQAISFKAYGRKHQNASPLSLPAAARVPDAQQFRQDALKTIFGLIDWADVNIPACDPLEEPRFKPRIDPALGMEFYWRPALLNTPPPSIPKSLQRAFNHGQLMAYVLMHSHGWRHVRTPTASERARVGDSVSRVLDLAHLAQYDARDGYNPYGGQVYLSAYDAAGQLLPAPEDESEGADESQEIARLQVVAVMPPRGDDNSLVFVPEPTSDEQPGWDQVLYAQRSIHASSVFAEVVLHHLLEIHMLTSVVSVALHNTFDTKSSDPHPFRAAMHVHFYSSTQVQELTTPHLLNRYATFPQIFALRAHAVAQALDDHFFNSGDEPVLLADCDFSVRAKLMNTPQFRDEVEYKRIFEGYAASIVRSIWLPSDHPVTSASSPLSADEIAAVNDALQRDALMTEFLRELGSQLPQKRVPTRFLRNEHDEVVTDAWTAAGLTRFIAEVLHLVTVRHETLGTKMALRVSDFRCSGLGAHVSDGGLPPKDNYAALLLITAATALKPFPLLIDEATVDGVRSSFVGYLGKDARAARMVAAFDQMIASLRGLQKKWEADGDEFNAERMRVMPEELNLMAGY